MVADPDRPRRAPDPGAFHVVVTGLMGAGKSTVGTLVATRLGRPWRDSDTDLDRLFGRTGAELATSHGVERLHGVEAGLLLGALADDRPTVIAAAASVVDDDLCRQALERRALVVVLDAPVPVLLARATMGDHRRTVSEAEFAALAERRRPIFDRVAHLILDARRPPDELAAAVCAAAAG